MSELKAFDSERIYWAVEQVEREAGDIDTLHLDDSQFYLKSEADKAIAELEESHKKEVEQLLMEIVKLKETLNNSRNARKYWRKEYLIEYKECSYQKYKRCLAMAKWCDEVMMSCELLGYAVHRIWANKHQWAMRWKYRWLAIADKYKEGNV